MRVLLLLSVLPTACLTAALPPVGAPSSATICSPLLCVTVSASPTTTLLSNLSFSLTLAGAAGFTPNLLPPPSSVIHSRTRIVTSDGVTHDPSGGVLGPVSPDGASVSVTGIAVGTVAVEAWALTVSGAELEWSVSRTYTRTGVAASDAFPSLVLQTTTGAYEEGATRRARAAAAAAPAWTSNVQMPSFLAGDALLNASGLAYDVGGGVAALLCDAGRTELALLLSPSGVSARLRIAGSAAPPCRVSVVKQAAHIVQQLGFGAECALGSGGAGAPFAAHESRHGVLTLALSSGEQGLGLFSLRGVRDAPLAAFATRFAQVYNLFSG